MKNYLIRPSMIEEARQTSKGYNWAVELLIFAVVYIAAAILMFLVSVISMVVYLFTLPEYRELFNGTTTDLSVYTDTINRISQNIPEWITIVSLLSQVFLIGSVFIYCRFIERRKLATLGFRKNKFINEYLKGLLIGFTLFAVAVLICVLTGSLKITGISPKFSFALVAAYFVGYMIQGMAEEMMCRGYLMVSISRKYSMPIAVFISSAVFSLLHLGNSGITISCVINLMLFGILAAVVMLKRGNIWIVAGLHSMWNFTQGNIFGIQVSGTSQQNSVLNSDLIQSKTLINGGAFGLEGGLAVTAVLLISIGIVLYKGRAYVKETEEESVFVETIEEEKAIIVPTEF